MGSPKNRPRGASQTSNRTRPQTQTQRGSKPSQKVIRERQAAQRALAAASGARAARRRRMLLILAPVGVVVLVVTVLVAVKVVSGSGPKSGEQASTAAAAVVTAVTGVPSATLDAVGVGSSTPLPTPITGDALTADGKPRVLYIGAEYCPFCAGERWPMIVALSRFGTWSGLKQTSSAPAPETYPNTATFSFHGATYTSQYLSFSGFETQTNQVKNGQYTDLDTVPAADEALLTKYDKSRGIPFVDLGGKYSITGATYNLGVIAGKSHQQIALALSQADSDIAKGVDGAANVLTAVMCQLTNNQPSAVCTSQGVVTASKALANAG